MAENWKRKARAEYLLGGTSYRKLAEKYGVSRTAVEHLAKNEGWQELRRQANAKATAKTVEKIAEQQARRAERFQTLSDRLMDRLEEAIDQLGQVICTTTTKIREVDGNTEITTETKEISTRDCIVNRKGLRDIAAALKDIRDIQMIRSELDQQEQKARIKALEARSEPEDKDGRIELVFDDGIEEYTV